MKVYALVGKSGTGKSYQAGNVCRDRNIESIIDDGLYIYRTSSIFGQSAKQAQTMMVVVCDDARTFDSSNMDRMREEGRIIGEIDVNKDT